MICQIPDDLRGHRGSRIFAEIAERSSASTEHQAVVAGGSYEHYDRDK
jgi:hypothetical protein